MKTCGECRFYHDISHQGECRFNPPTIHVQTIYYNEQSGMQDIDTVNSWWPNVASLSWCGKWQKKTRGQVVDEAARTLGVKT